MYKITVPASTANFGTGFDTLGMALDLFLEIEISPLEDGQIQIIWADNSSSPVPREKNLILTSLQNTLGRLGSPNQGFCLTILKSPIPVSRGLGSSSSAILCGILAASALVKTELDTQTILKWATSFEGHPDNVAPALLGGLQVSFEKKGRIYTMPIPVPSDLGFVALVPSFEMETTKARNILPQTYTREDCAHNLARVSFLVGGLFSQNNFCFLRDAFDDRIHQPYRLKTIPGGQTLFSITKEMGALGEFISGAGPTLMVCYDTKQSDFLEALGSALYPQWDDWKLMPLSPDFKGASVEVIA